MGIIMTRTTAWKGSFLGFSPYGPIYIEMFVDPISSSATPSQMVTAGSQSPAADSAAKDERFLNRESGMTYRLSANGFPVIRLEKGKYRVIAQTRQMDIYSDDPSAI